MHKERKKDVTANKKSCEAPKGKSKSIFDSNKHTGKERDCLDSTWLGLA